LTDLPENDANEGNKSRLLAVEDEMIANFCELNGGMELAMPMIRKQYEKLNIDFKNPSKEDLHKIAETLLTLTEQIRGEEIAREERRIFKELLQRLEGD
jgi:hypothetical protein